MDATGIEIPCSAASWSRTEALKSPVTNRQQYLCHTREPDSRRETAANLTGRRWGLKPGRLAKLSLPQVCESLRTREGRNPGTDAQAKRSAPLSVSFTNVPLSCSSSQPRGRSPAPAGVL
jgi:hypothetical protein